jgi:leucyl aminopeptidase
MDTKDLPDVRAVAASALPALLSGATPDSFDAVVVVGQGPLSKAPGLEALAPALLAVFSANEATDGSLTQPRPAVAVLAAPGLPGGRVVVSLTDALDRDIADVRSFAAAAGAGVLRASAAGAKAPLLVVLPPAVGAATDTDLDRRFARAYEVALLGALAALWQPLELKLQGRDGARLGGLGIVGLDEATVQRVVALEKGRIVARDLCGTEPEVMAPPRFADYCEKVFAGTAVTVSVESEVQAIKKDYPLLAAVSRACDNVPRHHARVIKLVYESEGPITRSFFLAGKGVTYDTGGADLKTDGHMAGMSRDKGGAAAVAGLFRVLAETRPKGVRVVGLIGAVRNSIGSEAFVTDEIIPSRAGVRVRIGNTDAEGRLVLADLLAKLREEAKGSPEPLLASLATLTGHAVVAFGPFTAVVETVTARQKNVSAGLVAAAEALGEGLERSRLRAEDYAFVQGKSAAEDLLSCNSLPSSRTPRGHQFPAAFLDIASGLQADNAALPVASRIPFLHIDVAGSAIGPGGWAFGVPTGAPILALAEGFGLL